MIAVITDAGDTLRVVRPLSRAGAVLVAGSGVVERRCPGAVRGPDGTARVRRLRGACERIEDALGLRRTGRGAEVRP